MNYLELMQRFWDFNKKNQVGSTAIAMYLYLLKIGFEKDCYNFQISDVAVSKELGLTRKTVKSTKEKLKNLGLIQFQTKYGLPCNYRLIVDYPLQISEPENVKNEKIEQSIQKTKDSAISTLTDSTIQYPIQNTYSELKIIPSLEEFMEYAKTLENYEVQLDFEIQSKYENWKNNGWKNSSDRPITNWKSTLKSTLPYMKNTTKKQELSLQTIPNIKRPKSQNDI